jgi:hypothetical protein
LTILETSEKNTNAVLAEFFDTHETHLNMYVTPCKPSGDGNGGLKVFDDRRSEIRAFDLLGSLQLPGEVIGDDFL